MTKFKDTKNREWIIEITVDAIKRVRDLLKVNLTMLTEGDPPLLIRLNDIMLLVDVIFVLVKPQCDEKNVTDEQFGRALGGQAIAEASTAFWDELRNFTQSLGRTDEATAIDKQLLMTKTAVAALQLKLQNSRPEELIMKRIEAIDLDKMLRDSMESATATSSQGSSV